MQGLIEEHKRAKLEDSDPEKRRSKTMIDVLLELQRDEPEYYTDEIMRGMLL